MKRNLAAGTFLLAAVLTYILIPSRAQDDFLKDAAQGWDRLSDAAAAARPPQGKIAAADLNEQTIPIVLYQTSDIHGHIDATPADPAANIPASGGAASLAAVFKERAPDLWLDSGDWFEGTMEGDLSHGTAVVDIFDALHLTATEVGNHEYDLGEGVLSDLVARSKGHFDVLGSNIGGMPGVEPYVMKTVNGIQIGVFGILTTQMSRGLTTPNNIAHSSFDDEVITAQKMVGFLRSHGAQIVIALTHLGIEEYGNFKASNIGVGDLYLAQHVQGIDLILGGHTHVQVDPPVIIDSGGFRTLIFQPGKYLQGVYRIVLNVVPQTGAIQSVDAHLIPLDPNRYPPDADIQKIVDTYKAQVAQQADRPLGSSEVAMPQNNTGEGLIYNWVTDTLRNYGGTDIGLINTFGIRGGLSQGPLVYGDLYTMMPLPNQMASFELSGKDLWKTVECGMPPSPGDAVSLRFSGSVRIEYDPNPSQAQLGQLQGVCQAQAADIPAKIRVTRLQVNGADVDPNDGSRTYTVTSTDYVAASSLEMERGIHLGNLVITPALARDVLAREIEAHSPITARLDGRIQATAAP